jgi:flagellar hook assembly protein FlgD
MILRTLRSAALLLIFLPVLGGGRALAAPVLSDAGLSVDAISPNGDGVQEFTVVTYTVAVDSADVRIRLTSDSGSVLDTLQVFTRQGRGPHSKPFDGTSKGAPVPDGSYQLEILAIGSGAEGDTLVSLSLLVDRVAPVITSLDLTAPAEPVIQNGDRVSVVACVDGDPETVTADFSSLDDQYVAGNVTATPIGEVCTRFSYTVTPANGLPDRDGLPIHVVARDRAGNEVRDSLSVCLSNHPPVITEVKLLNEFAVFQNGDRIETELTVSAVNEVSVRADFQNLDSEYNPQGTTVTPLGEGRFRLDYEISGGNTRPDGEYHLRLVAYDVEGCGEDADTSLTVTLDNGGALPALVNNLRVTPAAFSPNGDGVQDDVKIRFDVLEETVDVILLVQYERKGNPNPQFIDLSPTAPLPQGSYTFPWNGSFGPGVQVDDQTLIVTLRAVSFSKDRQRTITTDLELDRTAPVFESFRPPSRPTIRNGTRVDFSVVYDGSDYTLHPDFSQLDSNFQPGVSTVAVADSGNGAYGISYPVSVTNTRPDGNHKDITFTATDAAGNTNSAPVSGFVLFCLSNNPPRLVSAEILDHSGAFRNGDQISLRTRWVDGFLPLTLTADFSAIAGDKYDPSKVTVIDQTGANPDTATFDIGYRIPSTLDPVEGASPLPIKVTAVENPERGCGSTTTEALRIVLDNVEPDKPTLTVPAAVTRSPTILLSGIALGADRVEIKTTEAVVDTFPVTSISGSFSGEVPLSPGSNRFTATAIDAAGNTSLASKAVEVFFVQGDFLQVPGRFGPGDEFFVGLTESASRVTVHVFNLDGVEIARVESSGGDLVHVTWDGKDSTGNLASSGPYVAAVEIHSAEGGTQWIRKAFIFTRKGTGQ